MILDPTDKSSKRGSTKYFAMLTEEKDNLSTCSQNDLFVRRFMTLMPATTIRRWKLETEGSF